MKKALIIFAGLLIATVLFFLFATQEDPTEEYLKNFHPKDTREYFLKKAAELSFGKKFSYETIKAEQGPEEFRIDGVGQNVVLFYQLGEENNPAILSDECAILILKPEGEITEIGFGLDPWRVQNK
jgi:hypothetical protein